MKTSSSIPVIAFRLAALSLVICIAAAIALAVDIRSGRELVQLRNSLLVEVRGRDAYDWTPSHPPSDFLAETLPAPEDAAQLNARLGVATTGSDFDRAVQIARGMVQNKRRDTPIQSDTATAMRKITQDGLGYCADYTQVFLALAHSAGIPVREWGVAFDSYGGDGHAFVEIYDAQRSQWIFMDPFYSFFVTNAAGRPLAVAEFQAALRDGNEQDLRVTPIVGEKFGFKAAERALQYYDRGASRFYLWWGNNVFSYERSRLVSWVGAVSRSAEQLGALAAGVQPRLVLEEGNLDPEGVEQLETKRTLLLVAFCSGLLGVLFTAFWLLTRKRAAS